MKSMVTTPDIVRPCRHRTSPGAARPYTGVVAGSSPNVKLRGRIETVIRLLSPVLDGVLAVTDRLSRVLEPDDPDYAPARMSHDGESVPRGLRPRRGRDAAGQDSHG